jgi:hypothetical protein
MTRRAWIVSLALVAAAAALVGCGDNRCPAEGCAAADGGTPGGPFVATSITFAPVPAWHKGGIWLELDESRPKQNAVTLRVMGDGLDAYGVAGRLRFDTATATLTGVEAGDALAGGDAELLAAAAGNEQGGFFGVSRSLGERVSVPLTAARVIGRLTFVVNRAGQTEITPNAVRSLVIDAQAQPVKVAGWLGGTLTVK